MTTFLWPLLKTVKFNFMKNSKFCVYNPQKKYKLLELRCGLLNIKFLKAVIKNTI